MNAGDSPGGFVRRAVPEDAPAIAAVQVTTWRDAYAGILSAEFLDAVKVDEFAERWRGRLVAPADRSFVLVFELEGRVRGFVAGGLSRDGDEGGEVYAIYVNPDCQSRGAGAKLLEAAAKSLAEAGFAEAGLWVFADNHSARGFYESQGWRHDGTAQMVKSSTFGGEQHAEAKYARPLGDPPGPGSGGR